MRLIIVLTVMMGVSFNSLASESDTTVRESKPLALEWVEENKIQLTHRSNPEGLIFVKIFDDKEVLMIRDRISMNRPFTKKYDFSKLPPGKYAMTIYDAKGEIDHLEISLPEKETEKQVYSRVNLVGPNQYRILVNAVETSDMTVSIYDNGKLIFEDREPNTNGFHKIYKLQNHLKPSDVMFRISTDNGFSKLVSLVD